MSIAQSSQLIAIALYERSSSINPRFRVEEIQPRQAMSIAHSSQLIAIALYERSSSAQPFRTVQKYVSWFHGTTQVICNCAGTFNEDDGELHFIRMVCWGDGGCADWWIHNNVFGKMGGACTVRVSSN